MVFRHALVFAALVAGLAACAPVSARAEQQMTANFDVQALSFKVGEMTMTGHLGGQSYDVSATFGTTGLIRLFKEMGFTMHADGRHAGPALLPRNYAEQVNTGNRTSSAQMHYVNGVPELVGGEVSDGEVAPLDPATQGGTIDPLTALFSVLRDQTDAELCTTDVQIFDGGRRTRVVLTGRSVGRDKITCVGQFRRIAGYPEAELKKRRVVPLTISYTQTASGVMRVQSAQLHTVYGPVGVRRRN